MEWFSASTYTESIPSLHDTPFLHSHHSPPLLYVRRLLIRCCSEKMWGLGKEKRVFIRSRASWHHKRISLWEIKSVKLYGLVNQNEQKHCGIHYRCHTQIKKDLQNIKRSKQESSWPTSFLACWVCTGKPDIRLGSSWVPGSGYWGAWWISIPVMCLSNIFWSMHASILSLYLFVPVNSGRDRKWRKIWQLSSILKIGSTIWMNVNTHICPV